MPEKSLHFGRRLERARREKDVRLPDAADDLCIRRDLLAALEREDIKPFQSRAYAIGFLKAYADYLALDPAPLVLSLKKKFGPEPAFLISPGSLPRKSILLPTLVAALLLAIGAAAAWYGWQYWQDRQARAGADGATAALIEMPGPDAAPNVRPAAFLANGTEAFFRDLIEAASLRLVAIGEARLAVRDAEGRVVREGVLYPGEALDLPAGLGFTVVTPDQRALAFFMDGRRARVPAEAEQGLSRLELDRAAREPDAASPAS